MSKVLAIVSGGLDSVTLLHYLRKRENAEVTVLTFAYGQKHVKEIQYAKYHTALLACEDHQIIDLSLLAPAFDGSALVSANISIPNVSAVLGDPQPLPYVPCRNLIFLAIASAYAEGWDITEIYYGAQRHDVYGYWDTTPQFLERLNALLVLNRKHSIHISAPFMHLSKADILRLGIELKVDFAATWSCYHGNAEACGTCLTCAERLQAFDEVGIADPIMYRR